MTMYANDEMIFQRFERVPVEMLHFGLQKCREAEQIPHEAQLDWHWTVTWC